MDGVEETSAGRTRWTRRAAILGDHVPQLAPVHHRRFSLASRSLTSLATACNFDFDRRIPPSHSHFAAISVAILQIYVPIMSSARDARVEDTYELQNDQRLDELHSKLRTLRGVRLLQVVCAHGTHYSAF